MSCQEHIFAIYTKIVEYIVKNKSRSDLQEIDDPVIVHRIANILRLDKGSNIIIFDSNYNILCNIRAIEYRKKIIVEIISIEKNLNLRPNIIWLLPLLKKEAFESALYILTQMGVQEIQPIITKKTHKLINIERDNVRNKRIMIAAAEQSKQFVLPELRNVLPLEIYLSGLILNNKISRYKIYFDKNGNNFLSIINNIKSKNIDEIIALVGPEGDLTYDEKIQLEENQFISCALTKTVLRSQEAIAVGLGTLRSLL